ncbi:peptidyl-prolyl cis-trans isomerase D [Phlebotomus argentipes]|uniref:peptidyl-prolyl cis-trans isomerase D n=1 Tax=Phlebotomus argentipes TaxID=94469 RepID=UPI002892D47F|nr:peptidyl-prolyl cis-trans isomerase D [Phlebotomus argentipes]
MGLKRPLPGNPIVFLDIRINEERVGRMVIELRKDSVPKTAENFRLLCTGEVRTASGKVLSYRGTKFHKVQRIFMAQGGDVGESIYGPTFEDENFSLPHDEGAVSMANYGAPNTNSSQFFITAINCSHLDGTNVVVGYVLRGLGILGDMEKVTTDEGTPTASIVIENCGELSEGADWGFCDNDGLLDQLPPFPLDWDDSVLEFNVEQMVEILTTIRNAGNYHFRNGDNVKAIRRYNKAIRYYQFFSNAPLCAADRCRLEKANAMSCVNIAAVHLKSHNFHDAIQICNEALKLHPSNSKALFRRGQAEIELKNYENAIKDLKRAYNLVPDCKKILDEFNRAKHFLLEYRDKEKKNFQNMFQS